jgi:hypothetical protein
MRIFYIRRSNNAGDGWIVSAGGIVRTVRMSGHCRCATVALGDRSVYLEIAFRGFLGTVVTKTVRPRHSHPSDRPFCFALVVLFVAQFGRRLIGQNLVEHVKVNNRGGVDLAKQSAMFLC